MATFNTMSLKKNLACDMFIVVNLWLMQDGVTFQPSITSN